MFSRVPGGLRHRNVSLGVRALSSTAPRPVGFMFPGQGRQRVGMAKDLYEEFPAAKKVLDEFNSQIHHDLTKTMFEGPEEDLNYTPNTQPALVAHGLAVVAVLESELGLAPTGRAPEGTKSLAEVSTVLGHSVGEYAAVASCGAISVSDVARTVRLRGQVMQASAVAAGGSEHTAMHAMLFCDPDAIHRLCEEAKEHDAVNRPATSVVNIANYNSPVQVVLSGHKEAVERVSQKAIDTKVARRAIPLRVSAPFHCPLMEPARHALAYALEMDNPSGEFIAMDQHDPPGTLEVGTIPRGVGWFTNLDAERAQSSTEIRRALVEQIVMPVQWTTCVQRAQERLERKAGDSGAKPLLLELGPGNALCRLVEETVGKSVECIPLGTAEGLRTFLKEHGA